MRKVHITGWEGGGRERKGRRKVHTTGSEGGGEGGGKGGGRERGGEGGKEEGTYNGVGGVVEVVDPLADAGGDDAGSTPVALLHQLIMLSEHDEESEWRPHCKEVVQLKEGEGGREMGEGGEREGE